MVSDDSLLPPLSPFTNPCPPTSEAGSASFGCSKHRGCTARPPGPRDVIVVSDSETELRELPKRRQPRTPLSCGVTSPSPRDGEAPRELRADKAPA